MLPGVFLFDPACIYSVDYHIWPGLCWPYFLHCDSVLFWTHLMYDPAPMLLHYPPVLDTLLALPNLFHHACCLMISVVVHHKYQPAWSIYWPACGMCFLLLNGLSGYTPLLFIERSVCSTSEWFTYLYSWPGKPRQTSWQPGAAITILNIEKVLFKSLCSNLLHQAKHLVRWPKCLILVSLYHRTFLPLPSGKLYLRCHVSYS